MSASLFWLERFGELRREESEVAALRLRVETLESALRRVRENESVCETKCLPEIPTTCLERFPAEPECWCAWCVATEALESRP